MIKSKNGAANEDTFCVVIGGANMDILGLPNKALTAKSSSPGKVSYSPGGVGRNIAENIARLGNVCYLIAPVGNDHQGRQLIKQSSEAGINTSLMPVLEDQSTSCYLSIVDEDGEMQQAIADMEILQHFAPDDLQNHLQILQRAEFILIDTNLSDKLLKYLFTNITDTPIFVDTVSMTKAIKILPYLSSIHTLKPNLQEAETLSGIKLETDLDLPRIADWFHQQGVNRVFISVGAQGVFYSDGEQQHQTSLPANNVINSNGAGDALMAGLGHCWLRQMDSKASSYFALAAANLTLAANSTINPLLSVSSVQKYLKETKC